MYMKIGKYKKNKHKIEEKILSINKNATKNLRSEVLEYIRISTTKEDLKINTQYINFENRFI